MLVTVFEFEVRLEVELFCPLVAADTGCVCVIDCVLLGDEIS